MTLDQLRVFVAVAEREHLTQGAESLNLTPSAATAAIRVLEGRNGTRLFNRVGRRLELSHAGRRFLPEARNALAAAAAAELALQELGGIARGRLAVAASQTLASYWLPPVLMRFAGAHPAVAMTVSEGNTATVSAEVLAGEADLGLIEGDINDAALAATPIAEDRLVIVAAPSHPLVGRRGITMTDLAQASWVMRELGSGTRAVFETAMREAGEDPVGLDIALALPTNEAVCVAAAGSACLTVVSELVARPHAAAGRLGIIDHQLPTRRFTLLRHKERYRTKAVEAFEALLATAARELRDNRMAPTWDI